MKSAVYTGITHIFEVAFLIMPYLIIHSPFVSIGATLLLAVFIIFMFNYYISVAKDYNFKRRFAEMEVI